MAQATYTPISLYHSTTAAAVPSSANLVAGELALNTVDEKLYFKNSAGTVKLLASNATSAPVLSFQTSLSGLTPSTATTGVVTLAGTLGVASGGTSLATLTANNVILGNGTSAPLFVAPSTSGNILTSNGTTWTSSAPAAGGASLSNDTATATDLYPMFAAATSGTPTTVYTSNTKLLYKPSTGELKASELVASNGIVVNSQTVAASYTIAVGFSAMSSGPVTIASGQAVTVSSGSRWVVV